MQAVAPLLALQRRWSALPTSRTLVIEEIHSREGQHLFVYPLAGRAVHSGLASLIAYRVARLQPMTFSMAVNDFGFELLTPEPFDWAQLLTSAAASALFSTEGLHDDVQASLNAAELAQRRFREIARIAGLISSGYPGQPKSARQLQASSSLFHAVFKKHDPHNLLLLQAQREVLEQELEITQLRVTLQALQQRTIAFHRPLKVTPFALPLMVERYREKLTTEKVTDRVARMVRELEKAASV
jgi:ATP-dependent Lhr-like helicase